MIRQVTKIFFLMIKMIRHLIPDRCIILNFYDTYFQHNAQQGIVIPELATVVRKYFHKLYKKTIILIST